jgi:hypothetical protein
MVGLPSEDVNAVIDTLKMNARAGVKEIQATIFQPYFGTKLYDLCLKKKYIKGNHLASDFFSPSPIELDTISKEQILMFRAYFKIFVRFYQLIFLVPKNISNISEQLFDKIIKNKKTAKILNLVFPCINYVYRKIQYVLR